MSFPFKILLFTITVCFTRSESIDFNQFYDKLEKHSKFGIKAYLEVPDPDVLINSDGQKNEPCKLLNQTITSTELFGNWSDDKLMNHLNTSFIFADMTELINKQPIKKRVSIRRFLAAKDEYLYETRIHLKMPTFLK